MVDTDVWTGLLIWIWATSVDGVRAPKKQRQRLNESYTERVSAAAARCFKVSSPLSDRQDKRSRIQNSALTEATGGENYWRSFSGGGVVQSGGEGKQVRTSFTRRIP